MSLTVVGMVCYMLYLDWQLTLIFALVAPIMALVFTQNDAQAARHRQASARHSVGEMTKAAEEAISGQRIVKIFGATDYEFDRFSKFALKNRAV